MNTNKGNKRNKRNKYNVVLIIILSLLMSFDSSVVMMAGSGTAYAASKDAATVDDAKEADSGESADATESGTEASDEAEDAADVSDDAAEEGLIYEKTATDNKTYVITVSYGSELGIPSDAELVVTEIKGGSSAYKKYVKQSADELGRDSEDFDFAKAYDIKLRDSKTGKEYEPDGNVSVSIELLKEEISDEGQLDVVHFGDEVEVMDTEVSDQTVSFETDGFSVYVLAYSGSLKAAAMDAGSVSVDVPVTAVLTSNRDLSEASAALADEKFTFHAVVAPEEGSPADGAAFVDDDDVQIAASDVLAESGTTSKSYTKNDAWKLNFTKAGTYKVTITENAGSVKGVEYATELQILTYKVVEEEGVLRVLQEESPETTAADFPPQADFASDKYFDIETSRDAGGAPTSQVSDTVQLTTQNNSAGSITSKFSFDFSRSFEISGNLKYPSEDGIAFAFQSKQDVKSYSREGAYGLDDHVMGTGNTSGYQEAYFKNGSKFTSTSGTDANKRRQGQYIDGSDMEDGFLFVIMNEPISGIASFTMDGLNRIPYQASSGLFGDERYTKDRNGNITYSYPGDHNVSGNSSYDIIGSGSLTYARLSDDPVTAFDWFEEHPYSISFDCRDTKTGTGTLSITAVGKTVVYDNFVASEIIVNWQEAYFVMGVCNDNSYTNNTHPERNMDASSTLDISDFHYTDDIDTNAVNHITSFWVDRNGDGIFETEVNTTDSPAIKGETILIRHDLAPSSDTGYDHDFYIKTLITQLKSDAGNDLNPREPVARNSDGTKTAGVKDFTNDAFNPETVNGKYDASSLANGMYVPILEGASHTVFEYKITAPDVDNCKVWESALFGEPPFPTLKTTTYGFRTEKGQTWEASFTNTVTFNTVTYDYNDGTTANKVVSVLNGDSHFVLSCDITRDGYSFAGWKSSKDNAIVQADAVVAVDSDITLTAQWTEGARYVPIIIKKVWDNVPSVHRKPIDIMVKSDSGKTLDVFSDDTLTTKVTKLTGEDPETVTVDEAARIVTWEREVWVQDRIATEGDISSYALSETLPAVDITDPGVWGEPSSEYVPTPKEYIPTTDFEAPSGYEFVRPEKLYDTWYRVNIYLDKVPQPITNHRVWIKYKDSNTGKYNITIIQFPDTVNQLEKRSSQRTFIYYFKAPDVVTTSAPAYLSYDDGKTFSKNETQIGTEYPSGDQNGTDFTNGAAGLYDARKCTVYVLKQTDGTTQTEPASDDSAIGTITLTNTFESIENVPVNIEKTWMIDGGTQEQLNAQKQDVPFTITGVTESGNEHELTSYTNEAGGVENEISVLSATEFNAADPDNNVWSKTVYVPNAILEGDAVVPFTSYEFEEGTVTAKQVNGTEVGVFGEPDVETVKGGPGTEQGDPIYSSSLSTDNDYNTYMNMAYVNFKVSSEQGGFLNLTTYWPAISSITVEYCNADDETEKYSVTLSTDTITKSSSTVYYAGFKTPLPVDKIKDIKVSYNKSNSYGSITTQNTNAGSGTAMNITGTSAKKTAISGYGPDKITIKPWQFKVINTFTPIELVPVYVQKEWKIEGGSQSQLEAQKKPVEFTIYGEDANGQKHALKAYDAESGGSEVTQLTDDNANTELDANRNLWEKKVWISNGLLDNGEIVSFKDGDSYRFSIKEATSFSYDAGTIETSIDNEATRQENSNKIVLNDHFKIYRLIWNRNERGNSFYDNDTNALSYDFHHVKSFRVKFQYNTNKIGYYEVNFDDFDMVRLSGGQIINMKFPEDWTINSTDILEVWINGKSLTKTANIGIPKSFMTDNTDNPNNSSNVVCLFNIKLVNSDPVSSSNIFTKDVNGDRQFIEYGDSTETTTVDVPALRMTNTYTRVKLVPLVVQKIWAEGTPVEQLNANPTVPFKIIGKKGSQETELTAYAANSVGSDEVATLSAGDKCMVEGEETSWARLVYVPQKAEDGSNYDSYRISEDLSELNVYDSRGIWSKEEGGGSTEWQTVTDEYTDAYVKLKKTSVATNNYYKDIKRVEFYITDESKENYYCSAVDFADGNLLTWNVAERYYYIKIRVPNSLDLGTAQLVYGGYNNSQKPAVLNSDSIIHNDVSGHNYLYGITTYSDAGIGLPAFKQPGMETNETSFDEVEFLPSYSGSDAKEGTTTLYTFPHTQANGRLTVTNTFRKFIPVYAMYMDADGTLTEGTVLNVDAWGSLRVESDGTANTVDLQKPQMKIELDGVVRTFNTIGTAVGPDKATLINQMYEHTDNRDYYFKVEGDGTSYATSAITNTNQGTKKSDLAVYVIYAEETVDFTATKTWKNTAGKDITDTVTDKPVTVRLIGVTTPAEAGIVKNSDGLPIATEWTWPEIPKISDFTDNQEYERKMNSNFPIPQTHGFFEYNGNWYVVYGENFKPTYKQWKQVMDNANGADGLVNGEGQNFIRKFSGNLLMDSDFATQMKDANGNEIVNNNHQRRISKGDVYWDGDEGFWIYVNGSDGGPNTRPPAGSYGQSGNNNWYKISLNIEGGSGSGSGSGNGLNITYETQEDAEKVEETVANAEHSNILSFTAEFTLTSGEDWRKQIQNLPKAYTYYAYEIKVDGSTDLEPYNPKYVYKQASGSTAGSVAITNTLIPEGVDFSFLKTDGNGDPLNGATFTLYTEYTSRTNNEPFMKAGETSAETATSSKTKVDNVNVDGVVTFELIPEGTYYMVETKTPDGFAQNNHVYRIDLAAGSNGEADLKIEIKDGGSWREIIKDDDDYVIMNESTISRKVILRKVSDKYDTLEGARFRIFRYDLTEITNGQPVYKSGDSIPEGKSAGDRKGYYESLESGVYFSGSLPLGRYYLVETTAPTKANGNSTSAYSGNASKVFTLEVNEEGMSKTLTSEQKVSDASNNLVDHLYKILTKL